MCRIPTYILNYDNIPSVCVCVCATDLFGRSRLWSIRLFRVFYFFFIFYRSVAIKFYNWFTTQFLRFYSTPQLVAIVIFSMLDLMYFFFFLNMSLLNIVFSYTTIVQRCFTQITMANCAMFAVSLPLKIAYKLVQQTYVCHSHVNYFTGVSIAYVYCYKTDIYTLLRFCSAP